MKTLKLEVGKTYLSRKGEEVKIVKMIDSDIWRFCGNNDESYNEHGRYYSDSSDDPRDLIEEVEEAPEPRHTFAIPDGVKKVTVEQVGNRIVVEMVPEKEPKPGDVMVNKHKGVYIFKSVAGCGNHNYYVMLGKNGWLLSGEMCSPGRPATPEEAQPLWDALKKAGKRWNAETMKVEDVPESEHIMDYLQGYANNVTWNYEQLCWLIEDYLKHKEGEQ